MDWEAGDWCIFGRAWDQCSVLVGLCCVGFVGAYIWWRWLIGAAHWMGSVDIMEGGMGVGLRLSA